jgi:hypothetical protein
MCTQKQATMRLRSKCLFVLCGWHDAQITTCFYPSMFSERVVADATSYLKAGNT